MSAKRKFMAIGVWFLLTGAWCASASGTTIRYVKAGANGANDGSSWANAYTDLQSALGWASGNCDQTNSCKIWVAHGTYKPSASSSSISFELLNHVSIYGGFVGTETILEQRPLDSDPYTIDDSVDSVLSGDIDSNDAVTTSTQCQSLNGTWDSTTNRCHDSFGITVTNNSGNAYNVVYVPNTVGSFAVLDGFTITAGHDQGQGVPDGGGGMRFQAISGTPPGNPIIKNCTFKGNFADAGGGAVLGENRMNAWFVQCLFTENEAQFEGGAISSYSTFNPKFVNCRFQANAAGDQGGAVHAKIDGAGTPEFTDCLFDSNKTTSAGGALFLEAGAGTSFFNCTVAANDAGSSGYGGGLYLFKSTVDIANTIIWNNTALHGKQLYNQQNTTGTVEFTDIANGANDIVDVSGLIQFAPSNIYLDPVFANDHSLQATSPCIDAADDHLVPPDEVDVDQDTDVSEKVPRDLIKSLRFVNGPRTDTGLTDTGYPHVVDMGAFEYQGCSNDSDCDNGDECHETCLSGVCVDGPPIAELASAQPPDQGSLWRTKRNLVRIHFASALQDLPTGDEVLVQQLLDNGQFGENLAGHFDFSIENGDTLKLKQKVNDTVLTHRTWYAVRNVGNWGCVNSFELQYVVQVGDADANTAVTGIDVSQVNGHSGPQAEDSRFDIDGNGFTTATDVSITNGSQGPFVSKPSGH